MSGVTDDQRMFIELTGRRKRLFVVMAAAAAVIVAGLGSGFIYLLLRHTPVVKTVLIVILEIAVAAFLLGVGLSLAGAVWLILSDRKAPAWARSIIQPLIVLLLPLAVAAGRLLGRCREDVQGSFIAVNNALAARSLGGLNATDVLVLLPRCLQWSDCVHKVSQDVTRCQRCGRCAIGEILEATEDMDVAIHVSTGGTQARRLVLERRPRAIVAVACERELTEGIGDVGGIPVLGVINRLPEGPCYDTDVDAISVIRAIEAVRSDK